MKQVASLIIGAIVAACMAPPVVAQEYKVEGDSGTDYSTGEGWKIERETDRCIAYIDFTGGTEVYVSYTVGTNSAYLQIIDPAFKTLEEDVNYDVRVYFIRGERMDGSDRKVRGLKLDTGEQGFDLFFTGRDFINNMKGADRLVVTRKDDTIIVTSLNLKGSASIMTKLDECSRAVHRENPADPFSG